MYQGKNPIAKRSQDWLANALLELLRTKPYVQISIKDICDRADLSRQTFYQLFDSKEELARYALHYRVCLFFSKCETNLDTVDCLRLATQQFARVVRSNQEIILLYRKNNLQYLMHEEISRTLSSLNIRFDKECDPLIKPLANAFFTGALARSLLVLVEHNEISDEAFSEFFCGVLQGNSSVLEWKMQSSSANETD